MDKNILNRWNKYIGMQAARGKTLGQIRESLIRKGYGSPEVDLYMHAYRKSRIESRKLVVRTIFSAIVLIFFAILISIEPAFIGRVVFGTRLTYYVDSVNGDDTNNGLAPESAFKTLNKVNSLILFPGDNVLFRRGQVYRGAVYYDSGSGTADSRITFSAYGAGELPRIYGSENLNSSGNWTLTSPNIYKAKDSLSATPIGMIFFNSNTGNDLMATRKNSQAELSANGDFYYDSALDTIYLYENRGNPALQYNGIEVPVYIQGGGSVFYINKKSYINVDSLEFRYAQDDGLTPIDSDYIEITNNVFKWIYDKPINLDGSANNNNIQNNVIGNAINDSGLRGTVQSGGGECIWIADTSDSDIANNTLNRCHGVVINGWHSQFGLNITGNLINNPIQELGTADWAAGIYCDGCNNTVAAYNIINGTIVGLNIGNEIAGYDSWNVNYHHNVVSNSQVPLIVRRYGGTMFINNANVSHNTFYRHTYNSVYYPAVLVDYTHGLTLKDNIIYMDYSGAAGVLFNLNNNNVQSLDSDYNDWNTTVNTRDDFDLDSGYYSSLAAYVAAFGKDQNSVSLNPQFNDPSNLDFRPGNGISLCTASSAGSYIGALPCMGQIIEEQPAPIPNQPPTQEQPLLIASDFPLNTTEAALDCINQSSSDPEGDLISNRIRWYRDAGRLDAFENYTQIGASETEAGESWNCEVTPFDGEDYGIALNSTSLIINPAATCEDSVCQAGETCLSCNNDCGLCSISSCNLSAVNMIEGSVAVDAFNLSGCFNDQYGNPLIYSVSGNVFINVAIGDGSVNLSPIQGWSGSETMQFAASDSNRSVTSNNVSVTVSPATSCGDDICETGETCQSCSSDCGVCNISSCTLGNKSWDEDSNVTGAFNLSACFIDPYGNNLTYTVSGNSSVIVNIGGSGKVNLSSARDWSGTENLTFAAFSGNRTASSNPVKATVIAVPDCGDNVCEGAETCSSCSPDCGACTSSSGSKSGGGGGGRGGSGGGSGSSPKPSKNTKPANETTNVISKLLETIIQADSSTSDSEAQQIDVEEPKDAVPARDERAKLKTILLPLLAVFLAAGLVNAVTRIRRVLSDTETVHEEKKEEIITSEPIADVPLLSRISVKPLRLPDNSKVVTIFELAHKLLEISNDEYMVLKLTGVLSAWINESFNNKSLATQIENAANKDDAYRILYNLYLGEKARKTAAEKPISKTRIDMDAMGRSMQLCNGMVIQSLSHLSKALPHLEEEEFRAHVNSDRNDIAEWASQFGKEISDAIVRTKNKEGIMTILNNLK